VSEPFVIIEIHDDEWVFLELTTTSDPERYPRIKTLKINLETGLVLNHHIDDVSVDEVEVPSSRLLKNTRFFQ
jgi:hypothetical protein